MKTTNLKRVLAFVLLLSLGLFGACTKQDDNGTSETTTAKASDATTTVDPVVTTAEASDVTTTEEPVVTTTEAPDDTPEVPKSLKILAIGNSFSTDCMQYLYDIAKSAGVENIVLGNLYYGGCSLAQHLTFGMNQSEVYTYYKNTAGSWVSTANYKMSDAIADEDWDYISLQQTSKTCGLQSSYGTTLTSLVNCVRAANTKAKLIWNMTWAYQQDSTHTSFPNYSNSQQKMYEMIIDCVNNCIIPEARFEIIIPCMTSIQNARTSFIGDTLTRDGYHLDYNIGRYIAGLTWFSAITGISPDEVTYNPSTAKITEDMLAVAKESVKNAIAKPYEITESLIKTGELPKETDIDPSVVLNPEDFYEADSQVATANGVDLSKYTLLKWDYLENQYWNCTSKAGLTQPASTSSTYHQNVCTTKKYSLTELPVGTLFILDADWQYRLEIYTEENAKYNGTRPSMSTAQYFALSTEFLGGCKYISWNISSSPKTDISAIYAQAACHLRVYIPNS